MEFTDNVIINSDVDAKTDTDSEAETQPETVTAGKDTFSTQFWVAFNEKQSVIVTALEASNVSPETIAISKGQITELQDFVTAAAVDLPKYDLRRSQEEIDKLKKSATAIEAAVQPKKKFSFSSRSKPKKTAAPEKVVTEKLEEEEQKESPPPSTSVFSAKSICIEDRTDEPLIDITAEVEKDIGYQVYLKNCQNVTLSVRTTLGSARLENLTNCRVYLGPCCTSTYVENCKDCTFFIWCHQLRIHHAYNSNFYVCVNSHPIIEDCSALRFAPYSAAYPRLLQDLEVANLTTAKNWDNVVDFRWHRSTASPNWTVTPAEQRVALIEAEGWEITAAAVTASGGAGDDDDEL